MKRIILVCALLIGVISCTWAQQSATVKVDDGKNTTATIKANAKGGSITVTSDTTDTDTLNFGDEAVEDEAQSNVHQMDFHDSDKEDWDGLKSLIAAGGVTAGIVIIVGIIFIFGFPLFLLAIILYFVTRNRREKYDLAREALRQGKEVPQSVVKTRTTNNDEMWSKGVKNMFLGLGLMVFFYMLTGSTGVSAIGFLIMCMGVGQAVIAKTTETKEKKNYQEPLFTGAQQSQSTPQESKAEPEKTNEATVNDEETKE